MSEVLNMCRSYEASINYMRQMGELQGKCDSQISAMKHEPEVTDNCGRCGLNHQNGNCPARGSTCSACGRKNHWARVCHNKKVKRKTDRQPQTNRSTKHKKFTPVQNAYKNRQNSINVQDQVVDDFEKMSFHSVRDHGKKYSRTQSFATLDIILSNRKGVHELKIKVDTHSPCAHSSKCFHNM